MYNQLGAVSTRSICGDIVENGKNVNIWSVLADNNKKQLYLVLIIKFKIPSRNTYTEWGNWEKKNNNKSKTK